MLRDRLLSALSLMVICLVCLALDYFQVGGLHGGVWVLPLLFGAALGTALEMSWMIAASGTPIPHRVMLAGPLTTIAAATIPLWWEQTGVRYPADCPVGRLGWLPVGAVGGMGLALLAEMSSYRAGVKQTTIRLATAGLVTLYVGLPMALLWAVRTLGRDPSWGIAALVTLIAVTKSADAGAYFTGKAFGRHKLIPQLSPGKTWEGACGGLLVATVVAYASLHFLFPWICPRATPAPLWGPLALGLTGALAGMFGDLAESLFKRDLGVKDSGGLLPGLGGVWDVTDSLIGASLPGFLCFAAGAAGPIA